MVVHLQWVLVLESTISTSPPGWEASGSTLVLSHFACGAGRTELCTDALGCGGGTCGSTPLGVDSAWQVKPTP